MLNEISGGVCAARGFQAAGVHCGVKASSSPDKNDLALILSERECAAAAVYTLNRVKSAPVYVTMDHLEDGTAWGVVANSGNQCLLPFEPRERPGHVRCRRPGHRPPARGLCGGLHRSHRKNDQHRCDSGRYAKGSRRFG